MKLLLELFNSDFLLNVVLVSFLKNVRDAIKMSHLLVKGFDHLADALGFPRQISVSLVEVFAHLKRPIDAPRNFLLVLADLLDTSFLLRFLLLSFCGFQGVMILLRERRWGSEKRPHRDLSRMGRVPFSFSQVFVIGLPFFLPGRKFQVLLAIGFFA